MARFRKSAATRFPASSLGNKSFRASEFPQLTGADSILSLLENWDAKFALLQAASLDEATAIPLAQLKIHPPVNLPRQVFCSGANYKKHVIDLIVDEGGGPASENMTTEERRAWATNRQAS